jgi:hypothetical protein
VVKTGYEGMREWSAMAHMRIGKGLGKAPSALQEKLKMKMMMKKMMLIRVMSYKQDH